MKAPASMTRAGVIRFRVVQHGLDRPPESVDDVDLLDFGVQDTGADGAPWALAVRGAKLGGDLAYAWTWRGAPHAYRRRDLGAIAVATAPYSEEDAAKRIFDASKPLRAAGITVLDALRAVAAHERAIVTRAVVKGEVSGRLTAMVDPPYLRFCRPCNTTHVYEMVFRLPALQAGLELDAGTSPPILRRAPRLRPPLYRHLAGDADARFDGIRNYLRFYGPARVRDAAVFLDARANDVKAHWPVDAVEVRVEGDTRRDPRFVLEEHADALAAAQPAHTVRLVGPYDPYLQLRDRELLVDPSRGKELWPVLGRPGAVLVDGEVAGTWRPSTSSRGLTVRLIRWRVLSTAERAEVGEQAERLADHRSTRLLAVSEE